MPRAKIDDEQLLDALAGVFRAHGYEGASLSRLSEATGLQRASLYHRFPGGKEEMVQAVLDRVDRWFEMYALAPLTEPGDPGRRVRAMAKRLGEFYEDGRCSCLLDTLSVGDGGGELRTHVARSFEVWLGALVAVATESRLPAGLARRRAEEVVLRVQGSLVLARATGDARPFRRVLKELPELLTTRTKS